VRHFLLHNQKPALIGALALAALSGWGGLTYMGLSAGAVRAERDAALAQHQQLQAASGDLAQVEAKLFAARAEYARAVQGWAEAKNKLGVAQQELAALTKRLDQARDRVSQTGSIRPPEPAKPKAR